MPTHNEKSSFTANALVIRRTFTDIPFSWEIANILQEKGILTSFDEKRALSRPNMAAYFEARYLATDDHIRQSGIRQVVELAAGFSPRGIAMTADPSVNYIEVDLPAKSGPKRMLVEELVARKIITPRPNLHFVEGNVADAGTFDRIQSLLRKEFVIYVCEGLLRYVGFLDKEFLRDCIYGSLRRFGGFWVTPDVEFFDPERVDRYEQLAAQDVDVRANLFSDMGHAVAFFQGPGVVIDQFPFTGMVDRLVSPLRLGIDLKAVANALERRTTFVMTVRKTRQVP